jgi:hypothetical protein
MIATPIQSSAPTFSLATLREVLAEMEAAQPTRASRLVSAANIVAIRRIEPTGTGTYWVQSECDPTREYWVCPLPQFNVWRCTCKDFEQRGGPCKHALAVQMLEACEARERGPEPPPTPLAFPARTLSDDEPIPFELTPRAYATLDGDAA